MLSLMRPILEKVMKRDASVLGHMIRDDFYSKICAQHIFVIFVVKNQVE